MDYSSYALKDLPVVSEYNDKYDKTDLNEVLRLSEQNDPEALYEAGARYYIGEGVDVDKDKAASFFERLLNIQKHTNALYKMGVYYNSKESVDEQKKSMDYFRAGSECGDGKSTRELALNYRYGEVVERDIEKAKELLQKAIDQSDQYSYCCLGEMYAREDRDQEAFDCYQKSYSGTEDFQKLWSAFRLGQAYFHGWGVPKDAKKALPFLLEASEGEVLEANSILLAIYAYGDAGEQSTEKALRYLPNVVEGERVYSLAICGEILLKENRVNEAMPYLQEAADLGSDVARNYMDQVSTDVDYLKKRADEGSALAMLQLSRLYLTKKDGASMVEGMEWAEKAYRADPKSTKIQVNYCMSAAMDAHVKKQIGATDEAYSQFKEVLKVMNILESKKEMSDSLRNSLNHVYYEAGMLAWAKDLRDEALELLGKADITKYPYAVVLIASTHFSEYSNRVVQVGSVYKSAELDTDIDMLWKVFPSEKFESDFQNAHAHLIASFIYRLYKQDLTTAYEQCKIAYSLDPESAREELSHYSAGLFGKVKYI